MKKKVLFLLILAALAVGSVHAGGLIDRIFGGGNSGNSDAPAQSGGTAPAPASGGTAAPAPAQSGALAPVPNTNGQLTITGLGAYNGKWIIAFGVKENDDSFILTAADGFSGTTDSTATIHLAQISGGRAVLKVWKQDVSAGSFAAYSGGDTVMVMVMVYNQATISRADTDSQAEIQAMSMKVIMGGGTVGMMEDQRFSGGRATVAFVDMMSGLR